MFQLGRGQASYHHVSLLLEDEQTWRANAPEVPKEHWNRQVVDCAPREIARALRTMGDAEPGTVLFHCLGASLLLALSGVPVEAIAEDYARSTDYLRDYYVSISPVEERDRVLEGLRCPREQIHTMMEHLGSRYGGIEAYLLGIGHGVGAPSSLTCPMSRIIPTRG